MPPPPPLPAALHDRVMSRESDACAKSNTVGPTVSKDKKKGKELSGEASGWTKEKRGLLLAVA